MNKQWKNTMVIPLALCCLAVPMQVHAEEATEEFMLEGVNVTAMRYVSKDLDTPADTKTYTNGQLKATGAVNLIEALKYTEGLMYNSMGPNGQAWGGMTSRLSMRGVDKGTLVLVNGIPVNMNGAYFLDQIAVDQVEKVEIVKGSGSVLYGSEAFGGVINIITKKTVKDSVHLSAGNREQNHGVTMQLDKMSIVYNYNKYKDTGLISEASTKNTKTGFGDAEKNNISLGYQFNEHVNLNYMYSKNNYQVYTKNSNLTVADDNDYVDEKQFIQLEHKEGKWQNKLFWNHQTLSNDKTSFKYKSGKTTTALTSTEDTNDVWGLDTQTAWQTNNAKWIVGANVKREQFNSKEEYSRDNYAAYIQWDRKVSDATNVIVSARQDRVNCYNGQKFSSFNPQLQTLTKINDNSSWYTNIGSSFRLPSFTQMYSGSANFIPNPNLNPETGMNYEVGYKKQLANSKWKVALFKTEISDQVNWKDVTIDGEDKKQAQNLDKFRNTGIEVSYEKKLTDQISYTVGGSYGNPEVQETSNDQWKRTLGRLQLSSALRYHNGPTTAALSAMYYGNRVDDKQQSRKAMLPVALHVGYELNNNSAITFDVDNLLNRKDITTNTANSIYYSQSRSYKLGYTARF